MQIYYGKTSKTIKELKDRSCDNTVVNKAKKDVFVFFVIYLQYLAASPGSGSGGTSSEMENARPASAGEEELQLQLALAMSKEEHEEEIRKTKSDELKLQMALEQSRKTIADEVGTQWMLFLLSSQTSGSWFYLTENAGATFE